MKFSNQLTVWYLQNKRDLPWRATKNPYHIWLSEIILQQTRVAQGLPYYHAFLKKFPDVVALANADEEDVLKLWQGLGYYSRARNLKKTDVSFNRAALKIDNELVPYLSKHYSMKDIDTYGTLQWKSKTLLNIDKLYIFEDIQFENIMDDYLYRVKSAGNNLKELLTIIDKIILETEP